MKIKKFKIFENIDAEFLEKERIIWKDIDLGLNPGLTIKIIGEHLHNHLVSFVNINGEPEKFICKKVGGFMEHNIDIGKVNIFLYLFDKNNRQVRVKYDEPIIVYRRNVKNNKDPYGEEDWDD